MIWHTYGTMEKFLMGCLCVLEDAAFEKSLLPVAMVIDTYIYIEG